MDGGKDQPEAETQEPDHGAGLVGSDWCILFCLFQGTDHDPAVAGQCRSVWCPDQRHRLSCVPVWQCWRWRCQGIHNHFSGGCGAVWSDVGTAFPQLFANRNRYGQSDTQRISGDPQPTAKH